MRQLCSFTGFLRSNSSQSSIIHKTAQQQWIRGHNDGIVRLIAVENWGSSAKSVPTVPLLISVFIFSMEGGELFTRIQARGDQAFTERGAFSSNQPHFILLVYLTSCVFHLCLGRLFRSVRDNARHRYGDRIPPPHGHRSQGCQGTAAPLSQRSSIWVVLTVCLFVCEMWRHIGCGSLKTCCTPPRRAMPRWSWPTLASLRRPRCSTPSKHPVTLRITSVSSPHWCYSKNCVFEPVLEKVPPQFAGVIHPRRLSLSLCQHLVLFLLRCVPHSPFFCITLFIQPQRFSGQRSMISHVTCGLWV